MSNLIDHVDIVLSKITDDERSLLIADIVYEAGKFWLRAGNLQDFCLQSIGGGGIVFGGLNRVIWRPSGFRIDKSYCSPRFLDANREYL